jgi:hypothetical protein
LTKENEEELRKMKEKKKERKRIRKRMSDAASRRPEKRGWLYGHAL